MSDDIPVVKGPEGDVLGFKCPQCGTMKPAESKAATHCEDTESSVSVREHYERARPALEAVGSLDDAEAQPLGNHDFFGWYKTASATAPEAIEEGYSRRGTVYPLVDDYPQLIDALDRVLYSTISYARTDTIQWHPYTPGEKGKEWKGDRKPTPDYGELEAFAPFADIDLADEHKERPLDADKQDTVERAIGAYVDEFAELAGARESVFALDSVGGTYVFVSPQSTAPIAEQYDTEDRARIFEELASRLNDWLSDVRERVNERIPDAEGLFEPDLLNNNNRLYKAPLSIHKSIDGVVHPLDTTEESPAYDFVSVSNVDDELVDDVEAWGEAFTDVDHQEQLDAIIATLWDGYAGDDWQAILDAWLDTVAARERERIHARARREKRQRERRTELADSMDDDEDIDDIIAHQNVTPAKQDVFDALDRIDVRDVIRRYACHTWDTSNRSHETTFDPNWRTSSSGMSCAVPENENRFIDNGENAGGRAVKAFALGQRRLSDAGQRLGGRDYWRVVDEMREEGFDIPYHIPDAEASDGQTPYWAIVKAAVALGVCDRDDLTERASSDGSTYRALPDDGGETFTATLEALEEAGIEHGRDPVKESDGVYYESETCTPPGLDREPYDTEQRWDDLQGKRYQEWLDQNRPTMIWGDDAGSGKTTNAALAAARRERSHTILFDKHEKAREFIEDDATPDGYFHLKGGEQPEHDCCMNAAARADEGETPECPVHGHPSEWPRMNPIYELDPEDDLRERFEALVSGVGPRKALIILDEDGELLEDNPWLDQFDGLEERERVVGVHEYQTLKTAVGGRDLIVDETPRLLSDGRRITVDGLTRAQLRFEDLADIHHSTDEDEHLGENFRALADFAVELRDAIAGEGEIVLEDLNRPDFKWESYFELKDPMSGQGVDHILRDETLAQLKITYNESLVSRIREGDWNGEPFCMDALLAAAAEVGNNSDAARRAAAIPSVLDECPWCGSDVGNDNGARHCTDDACGWHEAENRIVASNTDPARAIAWLDDDGKALESTTPALVSQVLPPASDLPSPLALDATATPTKVGGIYGEDDVSVTGDEPLELDQLHTTQVIDGQYHAKTIQDTPSLQERFQSVIDTAGEVHEKPLFGIRSNLIPLFDFPENGEVLKYHAARGLNRAECDAVVCIGAPHPDVEDLKRDAELLAMDRDDLRVGGDEHSTRRNSPNPPVTRKLLYENDDGRGVAVPTKHYTGVTGDLFRESREKELEQFVHRIRPLLAESGKDAYLLTNVPTNIPVDDVVEFNELTGDLSAVFPVSEGAMRLVRHGHDALEGNAPEGFRVTSLVEEQADGSLTNKVKGWHRLAQMYGEDVTQRTVRNWIDELETVGLLTPQEYEQRQGVSYTADIATSKRALQVLSYNAGFEVAALRRFGEKIRQSSGGIDWLEWAESVFALSGDRCLWQSPDHGGGAPHGGPS